MDTLVCGSRWWQNKNKDHNVDDLPLNIFYQKAARERRLLWRVLDLLQPSRVIEGQAPGADMNAHGWALVNKVHCDCYPADWKRFGRAAGPIRNKQMLDEGKPEFVVAFHNNLLASKGTLNMCTQAHSRSIPILVVSLECIYRYPEEPNGSLQLRLLPHPTGNRALTLTYSRVQEDEWKIWFRQSFPEYHN